MLNVDIISTETETAVDFADSKNHLEKTSKSLAVLLVSFIQTIL